MPQSSTMITNFPICSAHTEIHTTTNAIFVKSFDFFLSLVYFSFFIAPVHCAHSQYTSKCFDIVCVCRLCRLIFLLFLVSFSFIICLAFSCWHLFRLFRFLFFSPSLVRLFLSPLRFSVSIFHSSFFIFFGWLFCSVVAFSSVMWQHSSGCFSFR